MSWFKSERKRIKELEDSLERLRREVEVLLNACTMRVGVREFSGFVYCPPDSRPVLTAMQAVQKLMADAGIEPKEIKGVGPRIEFVQEKRRARK